MTGKRSATTIDDTLVLKFGPMRTIIGCTNVTLHEYIKQGCPFVQRGGAGKEWQFNMKETMDWVREYEINKAVGQATKDTTSMNDVNMRGKLATAQLKEYELARIRGETVTVKEVRAIYEEDLAIVRSRILSIPGRLAQELAHETDATKVERIIKREISDALSELSFDENAIIQHRNTVAEE